MNMSCYNKKGLIGKPDIYKKKSLNRSYLSFDEL
jgi:hypothetical protein